MIKILINLFFIISLSNAKIVNNIAIIVNDEPVTTYDIEKTMNIANVNKKDAQNILINNRLETFQMKQMGIFVNELELKQEITNMLNKNKISLEQFKQILKNQNKNFNDFKEQFRQDMKKKRLYDAILAGAKFDFSDEGAKNYFEQNKDKFYLYFTINVSIYRANNPQILEDFKNKKYFNLKKEDVTLNSKNADPRLLALLSNIKINEYSPVLSSNNTYEIYLVKSKADKQLPNFDDIKNQIMNLYVNEQRQNYLKDYFEKLKSNAIIQYIN